MRVCVWGGGVGRELHPQRLGVGAAVQRSPLQTFLPASSPLSRSWHGTKLCRLDSENLINISSSSAHTEPSGNCPDKERHCEISREADITIQTMVMLSLTATNLSYKGKFRAAKA